MAINGFIKVNTMKIIRFKSLSLLNFKGIRGLNVNFGEDLTIISGKNALGKSSIADAIMWVLFGIGYEENKLEPKTYDKNHKIIPEIPHEVNLVLTCDGEEVSLKRGLYDKWNGNECKNTFKYYINAEVCTAGEYEEYISNILDVKPFAWIVNPSRFLAEDWKTQRAFLQSLAGNITTEEIANGDTKFDFVVEALRKQDIDKFIHHIKYKRKEVQDQLDSVPIRLEELNKSLPEAQDWEALSTEKAQLNEKLVELANKMQEIRTGGADKVRLDAIRKKIDFANKRKMNMEQGALNLSTEIATKHQSDILTANAAVASAQRLVDDLKAEMKGLNDTKIHAGKQKEECEKQANEINQKTDEANASTWVWNAEDGICPHCGQPLPAEDVERIKKESEQNFNNRKANTLKKLDEDFDKLQETYTSLKKILEDADKYMQDNMNNMTAAQKQLKEAEFKKLEVDADKPKTYEQILAEKEEYQQVVKELADLQAELDKPSETSSEETAKMLAELEKEREPIGIRYNEVLESLGTKESFDRITARIAEINEDKVNYQTQLDELDEKLDVANEFNQLSCSALEKEVNKHFKVVSWSLFKNRLNGVREPNCECFKNGVPYFSLNGAGKVNAGIDIAYAIAKFYDASVPMLLDECESVNHPICRGGQQIRFVVTTDDELKFEYPALAVME